jgi:GH24 family phage-related lysozyme (muramidase)
VNNRLLKALALATALAIPAEGLRRVAYEDLADPKLLTVCFGHTGDVAKGKKYSLEECRELLDSDMQKAIATVERCHPGLPEEVLAAFGDAVYNLGPRVACDDKASTASRYLRAGEWGRACEQLPRWNKARVAGVMLPLPGLTRRREAERELCLEGVSGKDRLSTTLSARTLTQ